MRRTITCFIDNDGSECNHYIVNYKVAKSGNISPLAVLIAKQRTSMRHTYKKAINFKRDRKLRQFINTETNSDRYSKRCRNIIWFENSIDIVRNRAQVYNKIHHISDRPKARNTGRVKF